MSKKFIHVTLTPYGSKAIVCADHVIAVSVDSEATRIHLSNGEVLGVSEDYEQVCRDVAGLDA